MVLKADLGTRGGAKSMEIGGQIVLKEGGNEAKIEEAERIRDVGGTSRRSDGRGLRKGIRVGEYLSGRVERHGE